MPKVVFVMGGGHCGSTLLDLILGSHTQAFSLGELKSLATYRLEDGALCGICKDACPFWDGKVSRRVLRHAFLGAHSRQPIVQALYKRYGGMQVALYGHLAQAAGVSLLIDSSKSIWWIRRQCRAIALRPSTEAYLIHMIRDGRAVANSYLRRYPERGMERVATEWARDTKKREAYIQKFSASRRMTLSYEQLVSDPEGTAGWLCEWLGIEMEPEMLRYWLHDHHLVGGNLGTRSLIYKYREQFGDDLAGHWKDVNRDGVHADQAYYDQVGLAISLDLRWRTELNDDQLATFDRIAGDVNAPYGVG